MYLCMPEAGRAVNSTLRHGNSSKDNLGDEMQNHPRSSTAGGGGGISWAMIKTTKGSVWYPQHHDLLTTTKGCRPMALASMTSIEYCS